MEQKTQEKKGLKRILDFIFGLSAITVLVGAIQDIVSAGRDWGYYAPIFFFSLTILLILIGFIPSINNALKNHFVYWKKGIIFGLIVVTFATGFIAFYSSKTENGLIVEAVPALIKVQELLHITNNKLDNLEKITNKIENNLSLQNMSFEGMLLNLNPREPQDFLKNSFILYKNNRLKEARTSIEQYIAKTEKIQIDIGELLYLILKKEKMDAITYLKENLRV